jgi:hypothetical protein
LQPSEVATIHEVTMVEKVTDQFVSHLMQLAYLSLTVLDQLLLRREPFAVKVDDLSMI